MVDKQGSANARSGFEARRDVQLRLAIPTNHPLRPIRAIVAEALVQMDRKLESLYSQNGRPSIAPERLNRALLVQVLNTIRSERMLVGQLEYNLLFYDTAASSRRCARSTPRPMWRRTSSAMAVRRLTGARLVTLDIR